MSKKYEGRDWRLHPATPEELQRARMKPLQPDVHGTGRWNYVGKNLSPAEVEALTRKGVDWEKDTMPDGRMKLPKFMKKHRPVTIQEPVINHLEFEVLYDQWKAEYDALPEPKAKFIEWFATEKSEVLTKEALRAVFDTGRKGDIAKTISLLFEHGKIKPKSVVENINKVEDAQDVPMEKLLEMIVLHMGPEAVGKVMERFKPQ